MKRYEIYLPINYNDGSRVEAWKFRQVKTELSGMFGGVTASPLAAPFEGTWFHQGSEYRDMIIKFEIITSDDESIEVYFKNYKETLKEMFQQIDILITVQDLKTI